MKVIIILAYMLGISFLADFTASEGYVLLSIAVCLLGAVLPYVWINLEVLKDE